VLVPEWIPPHLIKIPKTDVFTKSLELRGRLPDSSLAKNAPKGEREGLIKASEPKPRVSPIGVLHAEYGKSSHETSAASRTLGKQRSVPWTSNLLTEFQREHKEKLSSLIPPHVPMAIQFAYGMDEDFRQKSEEKQRKQRAPEKLSGSEIGECQMPLKRCKSCQDCIHLDLKLNCPLHMVQCNGLCVTKKMAAYGTCAGNTRNPATVTLGP
jgi:hypothetical protein